MSVRRPQPPGLALRSALARCRPAWRWGRRVRYVARHLRRLPHDPDFAAFAILGGDGLFLDIGANIGQSALSFRLYNRQSPILSMEPLPEHRHDLAFVNRLIGRHRFVLEGAAATTRKAVVYVPCYGHWRLSAQASMRRDEAAQKLDDLAAQGAPASRLSLAEIVVHLRRVDELGLDPAYVKIDVEGAEPEVLEGMGETLSRARPVLMVERSDQIGEVVETLCGQLGYQARVFNRESGKFDPYDGTPTVNVFFFPS